MEGSQITRGQGRPRKTLKKDLEINELDRNMVYDRTLWCRLIHVADWPHLVGQDLVVAVIVIKIITQQTEIKFTVSYKEWGMNT